MSTSHDTRVADALLAWYDIHGRKNLPWQHPRTPWRVWVSEIMLQQTQVRTVIPYFERFIERFPDVTALAGAEEDEVLALWSGLGYYSRARNLYRAAILVCEEFQGHIPRDVKVLATLPGIGASTAAAIASQAFGHQTAILDANVRRVLARVFEVSDASQTVETRALQTLADACMPATRCADYTQAIMDLGASCCTARNPDCRHCPLQSMCGALQNNTRHLYPQKRLKKKLPTVASKFLLITHPDAQEVYLEKRSSDGVWKGLWCFPSLDPHVSVVSFINESFKWPAITLLPFQTLRHTFSHYHLEMDVILVKTPCDVLPEHLKGRWFNLEQALNVGLPKPIQQLLHTFFHPGACPHSMM
ncbi:A/G specific adenine glycosylase [Legionella geestiana]|uniref:Adenine DNA glycosylase n=1 Tax=Legionella geestiana TaxID=45065 RepID=A0A0W0TPK0_9GAMM|nr:A/G-specific adenine glycosylase [Legionella geestiana]KTC97494.1 A/G specific adenine glycosylase [Legionella geestiana]QBS13301.1 A/G-specific adenine glycosylase [Legionella geestiana]QDQ40894.1 A/G-specific adenine glycosylase [Legionella geestiana]STX54172.1 A/G-specific adenine glycosylase [Legionella geestiana]